MLSHLLCEFKKTYQHCTLPAKYTFRSNQCRLHTSIYLVPRPDHSQWQDQWKVRLQNSAYSGVRFDRKIINLLSAHCIQSIWVFTEAKQSLHCLSRGWRPAEERMLASEINFHLMSWAHRCNDLSFHQVWNQEQSTQSKSLPSRTIRRVSLWLGGKRQVTSTFWVMGSWPWQN